MIIVNWYRTGVLGRTARSTSLAVIVVVVVVVAAAAAAAAAAADNDFCKRKICS